MPPNNPGMTAPPKPGAPDVVGVPAAGRALGITPQAVRNHLRSGKLKGKKVPGKFGPEWHFRPAVLQAFAAEHYGREVDATPATPGKPSPAVTPENPGDMRELYERLLAVTADLSRYKALAEHNGSELGRAEEQYRGMIAELQHERDAEHARAEELAARLAAPWWRRRRKPAE